MLAYDYATSLQGTKTTKLKKSAQALGFNSCKAKSIFVRLAQQELTTFLIVFKQKKTHNGTGKKQNKLGTASFQKNSL